MVNRSSVIRHFQWQLTSYASCSHPSFLASVWDFRCFLKGSTVWLGFQMPRYDGYDDSLPKKVLHVESRSATTASYVSRSRKLHTAWINPSSWVKRRKLLRNHAWCWYWYRGIIALHCSAEMPHDHTWLTRNLAPGIYYQVFRCE